MRKGAWHQLGDRSQKIAEEELSNSSGVGVILSPRDLSEANAELYSKRYRAEGADVLFDPQLYVSNSSVGKLKSYADLMVFRLSPRKLSQFSASELRRMGRAFVEVARRYSCSAVVAPAVTLRAGHPEREKLNLAMLEATQEAATATKLPVYASLPVDLSLTLAQGELSDVLARFMTLRPDGWMLAWGFDSDGFAVADEQVAGLATTLLRLAQTGRPVLHAFAGPHLLLSFAFGATAVGICHSKNMWRLPESRFLPAEGGGGGGNAPPRVFSTSLWSTFVYPDELQPMPRPLRERIITNSRHIEIDPSAASYRLASVPKWETNKHLITCLASIAAELSEEASVRGRAQQASDRLREAIRLHDELSNHVDVRDGANEHQEVWLKAITSALSNRRSDYDVLDMLL